LGKPYQSELELLESTYAAAISLDISSIVNVLGDVRPYPLITVGSGGSYTAAHYAALLHERYCGTVARPATPLDAATLALRGTDLAVMLLTAGGSNPDVVGVFRHLAEAEPVKFTVVCGTRGSPLGAHASAYKYVDLLELEPPAGKDGFLATNSLLYFAVVLCRAYQRLVKPVDDLPANLGELLATGGCSNSVEALRNRCKPLWSRRTLAILYGPETASAAIDLESKFTEAALGVVQLADFRSFAHGRHHWLAKHGDDSAVLALASKSDSELARRTLALLPRGVPAVPVSVRGEGSVSSLAALVTGLFIAGFAGAARGIDPGRPDVPLFGRKIYHLRAFRRPSRAAGALAAASIERKAGLSIERLKECGEYQFFLDAYRAFLGRLRRARFSSIVLDYDGTLCETRDRRAGLNRDMADALTRAAQAGLTVGIVTGRGKSVRHDLQRELPRALWSKFVIGYYNGSDVARLTDGSRPHCGGCGENLAEVARCLSGETALFGRLECEARPSQIMVTPHHTIPHTRVWDVLQQVVSSTSSRATIVRSGHSLDVLADGVSKRAILRELQEDEGGDVLCIGDRGRWPGNDFALLAHEFSLSVHEVSSDPRTCWNLALPGQRGPAATLRYLSALKPVRRKGRMVVRLPGHEGGTR
jgi:hypothetical protein